MLSSKLCWILYSFVFWEDISFLLVLCAIMKSVEGLVYLLEPCSLWELLISFVDIWFLFLKWDKSLSICVLFILYAHCFFASFTRWTLESILVLIWFFDVIWTILWSHTFCVRSCFSWCFVQIVSPFGSWKSCACLFNQYIAYGMFHFLWSNI